MPEDKDQDFVDDLTEGVFDLPGCAWDPDSEGECEVCQ